MSYQTGSALTDITELLNQLRLFCVSNGFTQHEWNQGSLDWSGLATSTRLVLSKNSIYYSFWTDYLAMTNLYGADAGYSIFQKMGTGYTPGNNPWQHPGAWGETLNDENNGTATNAAGGGAVQRYHFFLNGTELTVVWQGSSGWWRVFSFGEVNQKLTTFIGGGYCAGSYISSYGDDGRTATGFPNYHFFDKGDNAYGSLTRGGGVLRADLDTSPQYHHGGVVSYLGAANGYDPTGGDCSSGEISHRVNTSFPYFMVEGMEIERGSNNYSLVSVLKPITIWIRRAGNRIVAAARLTSICTVNIAQYAAGQEVVLGADTWATFPLAVKSSSVQLPAYQLNTYILGFAVKKVP